jgi:hypothetical protein
VDKRYVYLVALFAGNIIFIIIIVPYIMQLFTYAAISLNNTRILFVLNNSNDWSDQKLVLISNPNNINLTARLQNFTPGLAGVLSIELWPKNERLLKRRVLSCKIDKKPDSRRKVSPHSLYFFMKGVRCCRCEPLTSLFLVV